MEKLKKIVISIIVAAVCMTAFAGCGTNRKRGPLDVKKVSYLKYSDSDRQVDFYVITDDYKVLHYNIYPEEGKTYDYFEGEFPSEDKWKVAGYEIDELTWTSMVNVLTRVNFMELLDEFPAANVEDGYYYYIRVETSDDVHESGGYEAGYRKDPENTRFSKARQQIEFVLNQAT